MTPIAKQNLLDKAISFISPTAGLKRMQAKSMLGNITKSVTSTAGGRTGTLSNWLVNRNSQYTEGLERSVIADRADDLYNNDPNASSVIGSMAVNIAGTGITPQSNPNAEVLGISEEAARTFQAQAEWAFYVWAENADAGNRFPFWAIQFLSAQSMLVSGEFFSLPVMRPAVNGFSLALQNISSSRVGTPSDMVARENVRDGVILGKMGEPVSYYAYNSRDDYRLTSENYKKIPARIGHRPGLLHGFIPKSSEQVRGVSVLAPAIKSFKDLADYLDYELVGAIVAASFPIFIENASPYDMTQSIRTDEEGQQYQEIDPGQVLYGNINEKPHILKSERPSNAFPEFVERVLRGIGAAVGMPYEVVAKDFSKTNYSSARAALLEAWRIYKFYQKWLVNGLCQPVWNLVIEEAFLNGMITLPKNAPDFYEAMPAYCRATWIPPRKGQIDPTKEIKALTEGINANLISQAEGVAEMGSDWESVFRQRAREKELAHELGIIAEQTESEPEPPKPPKPPEPDEPEDKTK